MSTSIHKQFINISQQYLALHSLQTQKIMQFRLKLKQALIRCSKQVIIFYTSRPKSIKIVFKNHNYLLNIINANQSFKRLNCVLVYDLCWVTFIISICLYLSLLYTLCLKSMKLTTKFLSFSFSILILLITTPQSQGFIVGTAKGFKKCYYSDASYDKVLVVRFGIPRRQRQNCKFKLQISFFEHTRVVEQSTNDEKPTKLYDKQFYCLQMTPKQPIVYKHTSTQHQSPSTYRICVQNIQDHNQQLNTTMFQLQISQNFQPYTFTDMMPSPLIQSSQLVQLDAILNQIKRSLHWCWQHIKNVQQAGYQLKITLEHAKNISLNMTYLQILFLIGYGIIWVFAVKGLRK